MIAILSLKKKNDPMLTVEFTLPEEQLIDPLVSRIASNFSNVISGQLILTNTEGNVFLIRYFQSNGKLLRRCN